MADTGGQVGTGTETAAPTVETTATETKAVSKLVGEGKTFKDYAALEEAHLKLQAEYTKARQGVKTADGKPVESKAAETAKSDPLFPTILNDFQTNNGKLSEQTLKLAQEQLGMTPTQAKKLESFLAQEVKSGLDSLQKTLSDAGLSVSVDTVLKEAPKHFSPEQLLSMQQALDAGFTSVFVDAARVVAKNVKATAEVGTVSGGSGGSGGSGYDSAEAIHKATTDRRMTTDRAYIKDVEARISATPEHVVKEWQVYGRKKK